MKKCVVLLSFVLFISLASAVPTLILQHNETFAGETVFGRIETVGEFVSAVSPSDITFFEGRKEVSFEHDIIFYDGVYYFYVYTTRVGEFNMKVSKVLYKEAEILGEKTFDVLLNVTGGSHFSEEANETVRDSLSIKPGFFFSVQDPTIKLINKGTSFLNVSFGEDIVSLKPLESKEISFIPESAFSFANFSTYKDFSVPIIYLSANGSVYVAPDGALLLRSDPRIIFANIIIGDSTEIVLQFFNLGDENITGVSVVSPYDFIGFEDFSELPARGIQNLTLKISPEEGGHIGGHLEVNYSQFNKSHQITIPISLFVLPKESNVSDFNVSGETCASEGGQICPESCDGRAMFTDDEKYCCLGNCVPYSNDGGITPNPSGGLGWLWGILIFLVLGVVGYFIWKKYNQTKPAEAEEKLDESAKSYSTRISGGIQRS
ncbi:MAG: hypothetical protein NUV97_00725 [archaeon]|nr:hypothetical protein [archaeon]MCR4323353.1 hypothetical protein [Nanoarchaeota archaeon]